MCYHTHYIFLACGHSVSALHPIHPSPPCPNQDGTPAEKITAGSAAPSQRPFSFDPSVIASPLSPLAEPLSVHSPWRLESPFSTPDSASSVADDNEDDINEENIIVAADTDFHGKTTVTCPTMVKKAEETRKGNYHNGVKRKTQEEARPHTHCGEVLTHPYRSYKIEGLCLHCRRRRDILLASFEVNAIRETVNRESLVAPKHGRQQRRFEGSPSPTAGQDHSGLEVNDKLKLKSMPLPVPMPMTVPVQERNVHFQPQCTGTQHQQQQQTPWRLTLPPAEIPKTGAGLAGMRDGEWV